jgi:Domain of unknown function (DUF4168)
MLLLLVMKFPNLLQVSLLVCVASIFTGLQRATATPIPLSMALPLTQNVLQQPLTTQPERIALLQTVSNAELRKYAQAIIEIEPLRVEALQAIRSRVSGDVPNLMCHQPGNMDGLSADARRIFVDYCDQANSIVSKHGLTMANFNRITAAVSSNPQLRERLQRQVNCLQSGSC